MRVKTYRHSITYTVKHVKTGTLKWLSLMLQAYSRIEKHVLLLLLLVFLHSFINICGSMSAWCSKFCQKVFYC